MIDRKEFDFYESTAARRTKKRFVCTGSNRQAKAGEFARAKPVEFARPETEGAAARRQKKRGKREAAFARKKAVAQIS
jgi:hypothetical protein